MYKLFLRYICIIRFQCRSYPRKCGDCIYVSRDDDIYTLVYAMYGKK